MATKQDRGHIETSKAAYNSLDQYKLREIHKLIVYAIAYLGNATTQEVANHLKKDYSKVQKRFHEIEKQGVIVQTGLTRALASGRPGAVYTLAEPIRTDKQFKQLTNDVNNAPAKQLKSKNDTIIQPKLF